MMNAKIMVIDNNRITRDSLKKRLDKVFGNDATSESEIGSDTMNEIRDKNPDVVLMNIVSKEFDAAKIYVRLLSEDTRVALLSLAKYDKSCLIIAIFDTAFGISDDDGAPYTDIVFLLEKLQGDDESQSPNYIGKYILKGSSLQCA
jgi:DNA-binding NarL/FixJ family response regulator